MWMTYGYPLQGPTTCPIIFIIYSAIVRSVVRACCQIICYCMLSKLTRILETLFVLKLMCDTRLPYLLFHTNQPVSSLVVIGLKLFSGGNG